MNPTTSANWPWRNHYTQQWNPAIIRFYAAKRKLEGDWDYDHFHDLVEDSARIAVDLPGVEQHGSYHNCICGKKTWMWTKTFPDCIEIYPDLYIHHSKADDHVWEYILGPEGHDMAVAWDIPFYEFWKDWVAFNNPTRQRDFYTYREIANHHVDQLIGQPVTPITESQLTDNSITDDDEM